MATVRTWPRRPTHGSPEETWSEGNDGGGGGDGGSGETEVRG